VHARMSLTDA